jgi:hypothetical protein
MNGCRIAGPGRRDVLHGAAVAMLAVLAAPRAGRAQAPAAASLKIGTIGAGHMGGSLGTCWVKAGHQVMFSSRHPEQLQPMIAELGPLAHAGTPAEAVAFADVVLLAVPYPAEKEIGQQFGKALAAKPLVIDVSNPNARDEIGAWARDKGAAEATLELIPGIKLVRAFNAIHYVQIHDNPQPGHFGVPMVGNDANAIAIASTLAREAGYEPVIVGPIAMGRYLMPGTPLAGFHTPDELRQIAAGLE